MKNQSFDNGFYRWTERYSRNASWTLCYISIFFVLFLFICLFVVVFCCCCCFYFFWVYFCTMSFTRMFILLLVDLPKYSRWIIFPKNLTLSNITQQSERKWHTFDLILHSICFCDLKVIRSFMKTDIGTLVTVKVSSHHGSIYILFYFSIQWDQRLIFHKREPEMTD
jgi:hypothetical protein